MELTIQDVDRMFMALPTMLRVMRVNKITRGFTHFSIYLSVVSIRGNVVMGYHSGRKEEVVRGKGNPVITVTGASLSECVKKMYDMVQRLGLREDELLIIDEHNSIATSCQIQATSDWSYNQQAMSDP